MFNIHVFEPVLLFFSTELIEKGFLHKDSFNVQNWD